MTATIQAAKRHMRAAARMRRLCVAPHFGIHLATNIQRSGLIPEGAVVGAFHSLPGEIGMDATLVTLVYDGHTVLLPETSERGQPLAFREWTPGMTMIPGRFGTVHTDGALGTPNVMLVPLLAFDSHCNRLGYGAGYYDRTIAALPGVRTIGCAFSVQQVDAVPVMPHDVPLDAVVTETAVHIRPES